MSCVRVWDRVPPTSRISRLTTKGENCSEFQFRHSAFRIPQSPFVVRNSYFPLLPGTS